MNKHLQTGLGLMAILCPTLLAQDFQIPSRNCGTPDRETRLAMYGSSSPFDEADCSSSSTNPTSAYDPTVVYEIPVVVHIIMTDDGSQGALTDQQAQSQIDILNEDFLALEGSNGAPGTYSAVRFRLADTDPDGNPTTGVTRSMNSTWFNDGGAYYNTLNWDPNRYLNIYTNNGGGALGYVPALPSDGGGAIVGLPSDRVVILWTTFGRDGSFPPFNLGRTATHEVGHYLGLEHTFSGGCGSATNCYTTGDLICDTEPESSSYFGCGSDPNSCGDPDPIHNYMDYSDDICMWEFTLEQSRRMRCCLESYRNNLFTVVSNCATSDLDVDAGAATAICAGGETTLNASASGGTGGYTYSWEPTQGLSNPNIANPVASPTVSTTYTVTVMDSSDCGATDTVDVMITPNDGSHLPAWQDQGSFNAAFDTNGDGYIDIIDLILFIETCFE